MPLRTPIAVLLVVLVGATTPSVTSAQRFGPGPDPSRGPQQGVYVRDSAVAGEKLAHAERMERLKEWEKAADIYQEIVEKYADRVVPSGGAVVPAPGAPQRYKSVTLAVQERLGKWPQEGLDMYRARYEAQAATMRDAAGVDDAAALSR